LKIQGFRGLPSGRLLASGLTDTLRAVGPSRAAFVRARRVGSALRAVIGIASVLFVPVATKPARAQGDDPGAIAEALFRAGRELMASGDFATACPKFAESHRIDPKPGTLLNLALCHEKSGRTASAWAEYVQTAEIARRNGQPDRERVASARASALEPALSRVVIDVTDAPGASVSLDGAPIGAGAFGTPIPVDPGEHVVRATESGKRPSRQVVAVLPTSAVITVRVPALSTALSTERVVARPAPAARILLPQETSHTPPAETSSNARVWGAAVGTAGLVLVGVGSYFGLRAFSEKQIADDNCGVTYCKQEGLDAIAAMKTAEAVSTVTMIAGAVGLGAGLYLVLSPQHPDPHRASATVASGGLRIGADAGLRGMRIVWQF
jgi:hypothetical protein